MYFERKTDQKGANIMKDFMGGWKGMGEPILHRGRPVKREMGWRDWVMVIPILTVGVMETTAIVILAFLRLTKIRMQKFTTGGD